MNINSVLAVAVITGSVLFMTGCKKKEAPVSEVEQLRQYTEQRFNDMQSHLTVISEQVEKQPSGTTLRSDSSGGQPVVQITDITPASSQPRTLRDEVAGLGQPLPSGRSSARSSGRSSGKVSSSKSIRVAGLSVRDVQQALKNAGFNPGKVDGKMGGNTDRAIKQFQKAEGLKADGVVGQRTWDKLSTHLSKAAF